MAGDCERQGVEGDQLSEVLAALADRRRRYALYYLRECGGANVDAVAERVVALERERTDADPTVEQVRTMLHHVHLPALRAAALVEYDPRGNDVAYAEPPVSLDALLDAAASIETPPSGA